ncbi:hypothetical protein XM38_053200 [Halomicronema hongdechloris C2206]|uniref:DUF1822 domain-containing protein n=1 Tax=Halomicronema hongdechloris C2206 TaxID=1641165 RepID=A0A410TEJ8_9CYAN|nr:DUF1822 family protein [Halomicronema hongdechloris]QAU07449.1 hypothetical protein XM38_053200 [Halomicronema hongdechloris C2206]
MSRSSHTVTMMISMSTPVSPQDFDIAPWRPNTVTLPETAVQWALQTCQPIPDPAQQWQIFLQALALQGFQQWLAAGTLELPLSDAGQQQLEAGMTTYQVEGFRLCLVAQGSLSDDRVTLPAASLAATNAHAHFWVLLEVQEEVNQVTVLGSLRCDRITAAQPLRPNAEGSYTVPIAAFDTAPEELLLYLSCLDPAQLAAPSLVRPAAEDIHPGATDRPINVGRWLQDQLDAMAASLAWTLLPPLVPTTAGLRSPSETLTAMLEELEPTLPVPETAEGPTPDLQRFGLPFRLYALTWTLFESATPEWSLLLLLGPVDGRQLPAGIRLMLQDQHTILVDQTLSTDADATYLYGQVIGTWEEEFMATVQLPSGSTLTFPPFVFNPAP